MSQLGGGLGLSPQRLRGHKALESKRLAPCEPVIPGPAQLGGEHGERLGFAVFRCEFSKLRFPRRTLPDTEHGGFSKGQRRWTFPLFLPEVPHRFPPDSLAHLTSRQYETKSCTRGKRGMSWIS